MSVDPTPFVKALNLNHSVQQVNLCHDRCPCQQPAAFSCCYNLLPDELQRGIYDTGDITFH